tara:strand:+ start:2699 stop:4348 length:1650 start_codon:yes stop_codon:yes gene_type:complete
MRVPTYKQQTGFGIRGGGGQRLTASLNPNAATAVARTISSIGDTVTEIGMRKLEIETDTEVNTAKKAIVAEFEQEKSKALVSNNPIQAEREAKGKMQQILKQYSMGLKVNPTTGKPYLSSKKSQSRFMVVGQELYSSAIIDYVKKNNSRIIEVNKANISSSTDEAVNAIISAENPGDALENFKKLFSTNSFNPGILNKALRNGDYNSKEYTTAFDNSAEVLVDGLVLKEMKKSPSAMAVAMEIVDGKSDNVVLNNAINLIGDKTKLRDKILKAAEEFDEDREKAKESKEKELEGINNSLYAKVINIDLSDPKQVEGARKNHQILKSRGFYETTSKIKDTELFLGIRQPTTKGSQKSDREAIMILKSADRNNILTAKLVEDNASKLSDSDYKSFLSAVQTEQNEGFRDAKQFFRTKLSYNENADTSGAAGKSLQLMFDDAQNELFQWKLDTMADPQKKITYANTIAKAKEIYSRKEIEFRKTMKQSAVDYLTSMNSMLPNPLVFDENKPIQSTLEYMKNNPTLFRPSDLLVQNLRKEILTFKKFRIDSIQ